MTINLSQSQLDELPPDVVKELRLPRTPKRRPRVTDQVLELMQAHGGTSTIDEVVYHFYVDKQKKYTRAHVTTMLYRLKREGKIERVSAGKYQVVEDKNTEIDHHSV